MFDDPSSMPYIIIIWIWIWRSTRPQLGTYCLPNTATYTVIEKFAVWAVVLSCMKYLHILSSVNSLKNGVGII